MQIVKQKEYSIGKVTTVENMQPAQSIFELIDKEQLGQNKQDAEKNIMAYIIAIASFYLSLNPKAKGITNKIGFQLIAEHFLTECKNLEIQEVEFIFKSGIMGKFGEIYNDISLDTICGKNGWIETYYKTDRRNKKESVRLELPIAFSGKEITEAEFYKRNPEYKKRSRIRELVVKAKEFKCRPDDLKEFYKLKGYTVGDMQDDIQELRKQYEKTDKLTEWLDYQKIWLNGFIIENQYKVKN